MMICVMISSIMTMFWQYTNFLASKLSPNCLVRTV